MKAWRWILGGACAAAVVILGGSSFVEAKGMASRGVGLLSAGFGNPPWGPGQSPAFVEGNPFVEAAAGLVSQYLVGVLFMFAAPRMVRRFADALAGGPRNLARFLLTGILLAATLAAMALLTAFYIHLFPLPIVLVFAFFLAALSGVVALEFELGRELLRRAGWSEASPLASLAVGCLLVFAAIRFPYLGPFVLALISLTGAGVVLATRFGSGGRWSLAPLQEDRQV